MPCLELCLSVALVLCLTLVPSGVLAQEENPGEESSSSEVQHKNVQEEPSSSGTERAKIDQDVPQRIAVLPPKGKVEDADLETIRLAVHNNLGATTFDVMKPHEFERGVVEIEQRLNVDVGSLSRHELAEALELDGLLEVHVLEVSKLYAVAYAEQQVSLELRLYSRKYDAVIWGDKASSTQGKGGVSLNILGLIGGAVTSATVLRDTVKVALMNATARKLAELVPLPSAAESYERPPDIQAVLSNASDGPFSVGDTVQVFMQAEPGLVATFSMGSVVSSQSLQEVNEGEYLGRYVVQPGDHAEQLTGSVQAIRPEDRARRDWGVPGRISIDTEAPDAPAAFGARPTVAGVQLAWRGNNDAQKYRIERASVKEGQFSTITSVELQEYRDEEVKRQNRYVYRLTAVDAAGNESEPVSVDTAYIAPGPTEISGRIDNDQRFYPFGSPYQVSGEVTLMAGATLWLAPGTVVEFAEGSRLLMRGRVEAIGSEELPITFKGRDWTMRLTHAGTTANLFERVRVQGSGSVIEVAGTRATVRHSELVGLQTVTVDDGSSLLVEKVERQGGGRGFLINSGQVELRDVSVRDTDEGLVLGEHGELTQQGLTFAGNQTHVRAARELHLEDASFGNSNYSQIKERLEGPVVLSWSGGATNPLKQWLDEAWEEVVSSIRDRRWAEALERIESLPKDAEQVSGDFASLADVILAQTDTDYKAESQTGKAVARILRQGGETELWLQEVALGSLSGSLSSAAYVQQQAKRRATLSYLEERDLDTKRCRPRCPLHLDEHLITSLPVWESMDGSYRTAWVLNVLDRKTLEKELAATGLTKIAGSEVHVGVINNHKVPEVSSTLVQVLRDQGMQVSQVKNQGTQEDIIKKALEDGISLLVRTDLTFNRRESRVGDSIHRFEGLLSVIIYDTTSSKQLRQFNESSNALGFQSDKAHAKLIRKTLSGVRTPLTRYLMQVQSR